MIPRHRSLRDDERGGVLATTAVMLFSLLAFIALAFDLVIVRVAHTEAQRAADSGALAGASAFIDFQPLSAIGPAQSRALDYATRNFIRNTQVDTPSVQVQVDHNAREVWVQVERQNVPTWFARFFGEQSKPVKASAKARAAHAGGVTCLRPLAVWDLWGEGGPPSGQGQDADNDRIADEPEDWTFNPSEDTYAQLGSGALVETGWGSSYRNSPWGGGTNYVNDAGRDLMLKPQDPHDAVKPGYFQALNLPNSINSGASGWQENFRTCNHTVINVSDAIEVKTGDMRGPTRVIMNELYNADSGAYWDTNTNSVQGSLWQSDVTKSPRVLLLALLDPNEIALTTGASYDVHVIDFAYYFLETAPQTINDPIMGRFMYYAHGLIGGGPNQAQLTLTLQLVK